MADTTHRVVHSREAAAHQAPASEGRSASEDRTRTTTAPGKTPLAARIVLARLDRLHAGRLRVCLPDGRIRNFGAREFPLAELSVHRWRFFGRLLRGADVGAGESYVDGDWTTPDLVALTRLFLANEEVLAPPRLIGLLGRARDRCLHMLRSNTRARARRNIHAHYDLSNDFYSLFLDPSMTYSAALFQRPGIGLESAQTAKYRRLAEWAGLEAGDHVLEIGCGWGGFAEYAAGELGCRVTGITLSDEQARFANRRMRRCGLAEKVDIRLLDYRELDGSFDAIVSIEMLEAVGHRYLEAFFAVCDRVLRLGGRVALQTIVIPDQIYDRYRRGSDWIRKHIFPGGHLPSLGAIQRSLTRRTGFVVDRIDDIGHDYATTLRHWRHRFWLKIDEVRGLGFDERFIRLWDFYLATCEAAFLQRHIGDHQILLRRAGESRP